MTKTVRLLFLALSIAAMQSARAAVVVKHDAVAGCTKTGITFWWRLEDSTFVTNSDYTAGADTTATLNNCSLAVEGVEAKMDLAGLSCSGSAAAATFDLASNTVISGSKGRVGLWWQYIGTATTGGARIFRAENAGGSGRVDIRLGGKCVGGSAGGTLCTTSTPCTGGGTCTSAGWLQATHQGTGSAVTISGTDHQLSANTWYFIELAWDQTLGTNLDRMQLYASTTSDTSSQLVAGSTTTAELNGTLNTFSKLYIGTDGTSTSPYNYFTADNYFDGVWIASDPDKDLFSCRDVTDYPE